MCTFTVEYRCRPTRLLENMQTLFQRGREAQITGHIVGWNNATHSWIVDVSASSNLYNHALLTIPCR